MSTIPISPASRKSSTRTPHQPARAGSRRSAQERPRLYRQGAIRRGHARHHWPLGRNDRRRRQAPAVQAAAELKARMDTLSARLENRPADQAVASGNGHSCGGDIERVKTEVANWFDNGMDRLSGNFKRRTQWMTFLVALITAFVVNLDTFRVATLLWDQPALAEKLKLASIKPRRQTPRGLSRAGEHLVAAINKLDARGLPGGLAARPFFGHPGQSWNWASVLDRVAFGLVSTSYWLVYHRRSRAVRRAFLVRLAPIVIRLKGRARARTKKRTTGGLKLGDARGKTGAT